MSIDPIAPQAATRLIYPKLEQRLTSADLHRLFRPSYEERRWVPTIARTPSSQVALLVQLKIFQAVGRFLPVEAGSVVSAIDYSKDVISLESELWGSDQ